MRRGERNVSKHEQRGRRNLQRRERPCCYCHHRRCQRVKGDATGAAAVVGSLLKKTSYCCYSGSASELLLLPLPEAISVAVVPIDAAAAVPIALGVAAAANSKQKRV
ncbi:uncharacterized protein DS421_16g530190 [Arachis hypogaea]|nr:uncharacterized protein DS421_16g530190 [Arachis hypogaea]